MALTLAKLVAALCIMLNDAIGKLPGNAQKTVARVVADKMKDATNLRQIGMGVMDVLELMVSLGAFQKEFVDLLRERMKDCPLGVAFGGVEVKEFEVEGPMRRTKAT